MDPQFFRELGELLIKYADRADGKKEFVEKKTEAKKVESEKTEKAQEQEPEQKDMDLEDLLIDL